MVIGAPDRMRRILVRFDHRLTAIRSGLGVGASPA